MPCDLPRITELARRHGLPVVEDAACAIGSEIRWDGGWERIGRPHGDVAVFSFHPRKLVTTGDGGMLTTANPEWDRQFRLWRQHGMSLSDAQRHAASRVEFESYVTLGYNYRMTDIQGALGRSQLRRLPEMLERRRALAARYSTLLRDIPGLSLPIEPRWARTNWQSYCVRLPAGYEQRDVMQALLEEGIVTRRGIMCAHREPAYPKGTWSCGPDPCDCAQGSCARLHESERAQDTSILLPMFDRLTDEEQARVATAMMRVVTVPVR
jgi:dTDP-4-amino-4,6-dideoxygalactose transaminase